MKIIFRRLVMVLVLVAVVALLVSPWMALSQDTSVAVPAAPTWYDAIERALVSPIGVAVLAALWGASEALSMIPAIKANGIFQLVWVLLKYLKNPKPI